MKLKEGKTYEVIVKVMNPHGRDYWDSFGKAKTVKGLYEILSKIRDDFHDNYDDLDANVYIALKGERQEINPSDIMKEAGGEVDIAKNERIIKCQDCFHYIDQSWKYCESIGCECEKFISVEDYWKKENDKMKKEVPEFELPGLEDIIKEEIAEHCSDVDKTYSECIADLWVWLYQEADAMEYEQHEKEMKVFYMPRDIFKKCVKSFFAAKAERESK